MEREYEGDDGGGRMILDIWEYRLWMAVVLRKIHVRVHILSTQENRLPGSLRLVHPSNENGQDAVSLEQPLPVQLCMLTASHPSPQEPEDLSDISPSPSI